MTQPSNKDNVFYSGVIVKQTSSTLSNYIAFIKRNFKLKNPKVKQKPAEIKIQNQPNPIFYERFVNNSTWLNKLPNMMSNISLLSMISNEQFRNTYYSKYIY